MMLRAGFIARGSAVKIELSIGRVYLSIILFKTAVLFLSLEPSVKTYIGGWDGVERYFEISLRKC